MFNTNLLEKVIINVAEDYTCQQIHSLLPTDSSALFRLG